MKQKLINILSDSPSIGKIIQNGDKINLPNWYIAGGAIPTIIWNHLLSNDPEKYLNDIDIVYYNKNDISKDSEDNAAARIKALFPDIRHRIETINQARVHTWYRDKSGQEITQYSRVEEAIDMWLSVTAVGIRLTGGRYNIYAPYGLDDLFSMRVKPNNRIISKEYYRKKTEKWKRQWPEITVNN